MARKEVALPNLKPGAHRHSPRYIAVLALVAVVVLVVGFMLKPKPRKAQSETPIVVSQTEMHRLARLAERRSLDTMVEHFAAVAGDLASRIVQVGAGTGSGILWDRDLVLAAGAGIPAPESTVVVTPDGHPVTAIRFVSGPQLPLVAYQLAGGIVPQIDTPEEAYVLDDAEWVLTVWHQEADLAFAPGHYLEARQTRCDELVVEEILTTIAFSPEMAGGGLFDLDRALVAVILPCGEGHAAVSPSSVSRLLATGRSLEARLLALYGMRTVSLSDAAKSHFDVEEGALVSEIWKGHLAADADLRPGDVIVGLGEHVVGSPRDLHPLLVLPELRPGPVRVRRARRDVEVDLISSPVSENGAGDAGNHGVSLESVAAGFVVDSVSPGSSAEEAGLRAGDRIVRVADREPKRAADLRRALAAARPVFLELERGERRVGLLLD